MIKDLSDVYFLVGEGNYLILYKLKCIEAICDISIKLCSCCNHFIYFVMISSTPINISVIFSFKILNAMHKFDKLFKHYIPVSH